MHDHSELKSVNPMKKFATLAIYCCTALAAGEQAPVDQKQLLGASCGTVTPKDRDACCARKKRDAIHPMCVGGWKYVGGEDPNKECAWICETTETVEPM